MSGKYEKRKAKRSGDAAPPKHRAILILCVIAALLVLFLLLSRDNPTDAEATADTELTTNQTTSCDTQPQIHADFQNGLVITQVGKYAGLYMEDGTNDPVTGVLMIMVTNNSHKDLECAQVVFPGVNAAFTLSTLPAGASVVVLEQNRLAYSADADYSDAQIQNVSFFDQPLSMCEDRISLQILDGAVNVTNISDKDIPGDVILYYKNSAQGLFYGGITFRARIAGGLKAGEVRQMMMDHFYADGSTILFVTCGD